MKILNLRPVHIVFWVFLTLLSVSCQKDKGNKKASPPADDVPGDVVELAPGEKTEEDEPASEITTMPPETEVTPAGSVEKDPDADSDAEKEKFEVKESPQALKDYLNFTADQKWVAKASRALRYQKYISGDEIKNLTGMPAYEVFEYFLQDTSFLNTLFDFNLYFLGFKTDGDEIFGSETLLNEATLEMNNALHSVREFATGGDYLDLFNFETPLLVKPLMRPDSYYTNGLLGLKQDEANKLKSSDIRQRIIELISSRVQNSLANANNKKYTEACNQLLKIPHKPEYGDAEEISISGTIDSLGIDNVLTDPLFSAAFDLEDACDPQMLRENPDKFAKDLQSFSEYLSQTLDFARTLPEIDRELQIADLVEIEKMPVEEFGFGLKRNQALNSVFFNRFTNSSTNENRNRGAYILKTYFCDDLIPITVVNVKQHTNDGAHASDPACYSCHFKLDPLAGFFRHYGIGGINFTQITEQQANLIKQLLSVDEFAFLFDDQTVLNKEQAESYYNRWKSTSPERTWNVGYIRSSTDESLNQYGDSLEDLFGIIRKAPEARECLVQRMAEYFIGANLTYDDNWLASIAANLNQANTSEGIKIALGGILGSNAFKKHNPISTECYDYAEGENASNAPPCEINAAIKTYCVGCHNTSKPSSGLDLSVWQPFVDGKPSFSHVHKATNTFVPACVTFKKMKERIATDDLFTIMPPGGDMLSKHKEKLFLWLDKQLNQCGGA